MAGSFSWIAAAERLKPDSYTNLCPLIRSSLGSSQKTILLSLILTKNNTKFIKQK
jgi:hypothetical protein